MTDLLYIENLEKRANLLQEMFEEDSEAYKEFVNVVQGFKDQYEDFAERVTKLEDTVFTLVNMLKQRSNRDTRYLQELESATINDCSSLRDNCMSPTPRVYPSYEGINEGFNHNY